tara:strand:+ start:235 stop:1059 length:825 start_codon:yes stop_codon:yes gene_type:complete
MTAQIIDGVLIAREIESELKIRINKLSFKPILSVIQIGDDSASSSYISAKTKAADRIGIELQHHHLPTDISLNDLNSLIDILNSESNGIIIQLPIPETLLPCLTRISPEKDVDGFHPMNLGRLMRGEPSLLPCTPAGIIELLTRSDYNLNGRHVVVIGRSNIVGKPLAILLLSKGIDATTTICHSKTKDISQYTKVADIVVVATGCPNTLTEDMVTENSIIIDVGINRTDSGLVGDCAPNVINKVKAITPVPGGVGPMTVAMLMNNTVSASERP